MRLIDAGQIVYSWFVEEDGTMSDGITLQSIINRLPTIDAVPVIRCKDCKWFGEIGCAIRIVDDSDKPKEDDYCSFAERRSDNANIDT